MDEGIPALSRRGVLAGVGGLGASSLAGCTQQFWSRAEDGRPEQVEMTIKTVPADDDQYAATILSHLRENVQAAGIDVAHEPIAQAELYRDVLLEGDYDMFVLRHPGLEEFDALRDLLHSSFVAEAGWQNPFQFSDVAADESLEDQQSTEADREDALEGLFEFLEESAPYTAICYPEQVGGTRTELDAPVSPRQPLDYLECLTTVPADDSREGPLRVGVYGEGLSDRLNPIVVDRNRIDGLLELLYDPLVRRVPDDDAYVPWLAADVSWADDDGVQATVTIREGASWHDGEPLDADDVVFTWEFLADTSLGKLDGGVPAPQYRPAQVLADSVNALDSETVEFSFGTTIRTAAMRTLTTPLLPEHIWEPRSELVSDQLTEALASDNQEPIGSGLFALESASPDAIELEPFDDHPLAESAEDRPDILEGLNDYPSLEFRIAPNAGGMIEALVDDEIDVTASPIPIESIDRIHDESEVELVSRPSESFYMIGYNLHHPELGNPRVRQTLSRLIDREYVVAELFDGYAEPASTLSTLVGVPPERWERDRDSTVAEFPGADGEPHTQTVRSLFEEIGYRYDDDVLLR